MSSEFFIIGVTILVGYLAILFAERYKFSQVLLLMIFGFLLGPILGIVPVGHDSIISQIYPFMSTLALIILLFDGGISLNIFNVFKQITRSTIFTFLTFSLNILISGVLIFIYNYSLLQALTIGAVLGGTSSAIVIAMIENLNISKDVKSALTIESTISDSLTIIAAFILLQLFQTNSFDIGSVAHMLVSSFSISIVFGIAGAFAWAFILDKLIRLKLDYMLTLSILFILYSITDAVGANGGFAVFIFALVFGNLRNIPEELLNFAGKKQRSIKRFQSQITFFVRTFFFTYIGLLMPMEAWLNVDVWLISFILIGLFFISRFISLKLVFRDINEKDFKAALLMIPRGLAAAVVIGLFPSSVKIDNLSDIVFMVIFMTNLIATVSMFVLEKKEQEKEEVKEGIKEIKEKINERIKENNKNKKIGKEPLNKIKEKIKKMEKKK